MNKLFFCLSFFLSISNCQTNQDASATKALYQHWVHSYEDEDGTGKVYRISSYDFPPSRGRHGFQLQKEGECIEFAIARGDGIEKRMANWVFESSDIIKITFKDATIPSVKYRILSVSESMLKLEELSN